MESGATVEGHIVEKVNIWLKGLQYFNSTMLKKVMLRAVKW